MNCARWTLTPALCRGGSGAGDTRVFRDRSQAGPINFPLGEIVNVLLPPSDLPAALATAGLAAKTPPFGKRVLPARLTVACFSTCRKSP